MYNSCSNTIQLDLRKRWYAVYTKPRWEKRLEKELKERGIEVFLPKCENMKPWSDRLKKVVEPLFPSYIFVKVVYGKSYLPVLDATGAVAFVKSESRPVIVQERQIESIKRLMTLGEDFEVASNAFAEGDIVQINSGKFKGIEGIVLREQGRRKLLIQIDAIGQGVKVDIPAGRLKKKQPVNK